MYLLNPLLLSATLWQKYFYDHYFIDKKTEAEERISNVSVEGLGLNP